MKHISGAEKSLLVGDDAAATLLEYAAFVANRRIADTVTLSAYSDTGEDVAATFLLTEGSFLISESTHSSLPEPDNAEAVSRMRQSMTDAGMGRRAVPSTAEDFEFDHLS